MYAQQLKWHVKMENNKDSVLKKSLQGGRANADSIGISAAVIISWLASTYSGISMPAEVVAAMSGLIGAIAARIKK